MAESKHGTLVVTTQPWPRTPQSERRARRAARSLIPGARRSRLVWVGQTLTAEGFVRYGFRIHTTPKESIDG